MAWFRVDDGFANSRQILSIPRRYRTQAAGLWVLAGTWSAKELTDGFIPEYLLEELASSPAIAAHLIRAGLWEKAENGYQLIGWAKYQFTKDQVLTRRTEEAERKRRARESKRKTRDQQQQSNVRDVSRADTMRSPHDVRPVSALPDPTRPDPNQLLITSSGELTSVAGPEPPRQCPKHITTPNPPPCGGCGDARKNHDAWTARTEQARDAMKAQRRHAIDNCDICDDSGLIDTGDTVTRCNHQALTSA